MYPPSRRYGTGPGPAALVASPRAVRSAPRPMAPSGGSAGRLRPQHSCRRSWASAPLNGTYQARRDGLRFIVCPAMPPSSPPGWSGGKEGKRRAAQGRSRWALSFVFSRFPRPPLLLCGEDEWFSPTIMAATMKKAVSAGGGKGVFSLSASKCSVVPPKRRIRGGGSSEPLCCPPG